MAWFYPRLSRPDFHLLRGPGAGLGNLLFAWARAELYAQRSGGGVVAPTWRSIKFGPLLRGEADARTYGDLFAHRDIKGFSADFWRKLALRRVPEAEFRKFGAPANALVVVEGPARHFADLAGTAPLLASRLRQMVCRPPARHAPFIGLHVRTGDFSAPEATYRRNSRIEPDWFAAELLRVREEVGPLPARVFTDDMTGAVERCFGGIAGVAMVAPGDAISDLLHLSQGQHLICSNSTFSLWAAFLSQGTVSSRFTALFPDYGLMDPRFLERVQ